MGNALFILGDFFEFWAGDDTASPLHLDIAAHLKQLSEKGTHIFIMPGNRDILLGKQYCQLAGAKLISDPIKITHLGTSILLAHGDAYCTSDKAYMRYRRFANNSIVQWLLLQLSKDCRLKLAQKIRQSSKAKFSKNPIMVDVNTKAVDKAMQKAKVSTLIHGHTHEFATHKIDDSRQRLVLGDWHETGSYIVLDSSGIQLKPFT